MILIDDNLSGIQICTLESVSKRVLRVKSDEVSIERIICGIHISSELTTEFCYSFKAIDELLSLLLPG